MKKKISMLLAAALTASLLGGCSGQSSASTTAAPAKEQTVAETKAAQSKAEETKGEESKSEESAKSEASSVVWPKDSVQLIVAATAGGFADTHARLIAQYMQEKTGVPFAVVNQADGGGIVAYDTVKNAKPDGNTLLFYHSNFALACETNVYEADSINDFTTVAQLETGGSQVMVVSAKSPYTTLDEFIDAAIEKPGQLSYGIQAGGGSQFMGALLMKDKPCELNLVEAGNQTEKIASMLGGYLDACNISASTAAQYVESGDMRVLCSFGSKVDPYYPDYIPAAEQGYPSAVFESDFWLHGPAGMDPALADAINLAFKDMENDESMKEALAAQTSEYVWRDREESLKNYKELCQNLSDTAASLGLK